MYNNTKNIDIYGNEFVVDNLIMRISGDNYAVICVCDNNAQAHETLKQWQKNSKSAEKKSWFNWLFRK